MDCDGLHVLLSFHVLVIKQLSWKVEFACIDSVFGNNC